jgi:hypothetical protein
MQNLKTLTREYGLSNEQMVEIVIEDEKFREFILRNGLEHYQFNGEMEKLIREQIEKSDTFKEHRHFLSSN